MMQKLNKLYEQIIAESKRKPVKRRKVRIKNIPTTKNMDQYCEGKTKPMKTPLTQTKNVK